MVFSRLVRSSLIVRVQPDIEIVVGRQIVEFAACLAQPYPRASPIRIEVLDSSDGSRADTGEALD